MKTLWTILSVSALALAGCSGMTGSDGAVSEDIVSSTATVTSVDYDERVVTMTADESGDTITVFANDGIQNLDQLEAGDKVVADYYESVAVNMADPMDPGGDLTVIDSISAPEGEKPGAMAVATRNLVVEVVSYDSATGFATLTMPDGTTNRVTVPGELRSFAERLNPGDRVEVSITDAVAVTIEEVTG